VCSAINKIKPYTDGGFFDRRFQLKNAHEKKSTGLTLEPSVENHFHLRCIFTYGSLKKTASENPFPVAIFVTKPPVEIMYFYK